MNVAAISGRLGGDPELNEVNDSTVANFSVAEDHGYGTNWFDVAAWGQNAEFVDTHFSKGDRIEVTGTLEIDDEYGLSIRANRVSFGDSSTQEDVPETNNTSDEFAPEEETPF